MGAGPAGRASAYGAGASPSYSPGIPASHPGCPAVFVGRRSPPVWCARASPRARAHRPGSSVGTSVRLKIGRSAVRPRPWPPICARHSPYADSWPAQGQHEANIGTGNRVAGPQVGAALHRQGRRARRGSAHPARSNTRGRRCGPRPASTPVGCLSRPGQAHHPRRLTLPTSDRPHQPPGPQACADDSRPPPEAFLGTYRFECTPTRWNETGTRKEALSCSGTWDFKD